MKKGKHLPLEERSLVDTNESTPLGSIFVDVLDGKLSAES